MTAGGRSLGDGRAADGVDRPGSVAELGEVVRRRVAEGLAIYPQGGRSALDYGDPPSKPGAAVDLTALARVVDYPVADMTITVEAGITLAALRSILGAEGQRLTLDPPDADRATLGGVFATDASGPRRLGSGRPRDQILGIRFVDAAGRALQGGGRVVKNVAGYDFPKLLTGSLGTLGVIAEMTLKVRPRPEAAAIAWMTAPAAGPVAAALDRLNTSRTRPMAVELLNPTASGPIGAPAGVDAGRWTLAVGFEGGEAAVAWQASTIRDELGDLLGVEVVEGAAADPVWSALSEFPAAGEGPIGASATVRPSMVVDYAAGFDPAAWSVSAHAGSGVVRAVSTGPGTLDAATRAVPGLRRRAEAAGGAFVLTRCPTPLKAGLGVWGTRRGDRGLMETIRRALDPAGVMNPRIAADRLP